MEVAFLDKRLEKLYEKVKKGTRLSKEDGLLLFETDDLVSVGIVADFVRRKKHGKKAFYVYNQHINYTNICKNRCLFCAYAVDKGDPASYSWNMEDIEKRLMDRIDEPVKELHIVGGLNPDQDFSYFTNLLKTVKKIRPKASIKAFTSVEIDYLSRLSGLSVSETVAILKDAGLDMMPGGGAEVLSDRVREKLFPKKMGAARWLAIMEEVHMAGLTSNATMLYGHIETIEERVEHLMALRELQDRTGGFSAFIPLAFHSKNTKLHHIPPTTAFDDLKMVAVSRLMLDNFDHIKAYWVMIGEKLAQVALAYGADDLDGTIIEERITHTAGAKSAKGLTREEMEDMIKGAGFVPVERDSFYNNVHGGLPPQSKG
ncbi:Radical SAM domain protein [Desulfamplus magnetovallimortis]|uniref:Aminodeoxyfutalosine synthase n=1 Tax=Desulfamplus magnetovallimortis TaxID=1246637 RepID=A0A1W1HCH6_9BACT|nr:aminofutalosine synthase MqnE [Desulfamplus magnetovallimortis]SLM30136.1 Radical SAM domain protein [Desulfamplus magnetovallimortis]